MKAKKSNPKEMEIRMFLDNAGTFRLKAKGDPMLMAEGLAALMLQNKMLRDIVLVAQKSVEQVENSEVEQN